MESKHKKVYRSDWLIVQKSVTFLQPNILGTGPEMISTQSTGWKQFFGILTVNGLYLYRSPPPALTLSTSSEKDSLPEPVESLGGLLTAAVRPASFAKHNKENCFEIICRSPVIQGGQPASPTYADKEMEHVFMASSSKLRKQWVDAIRRMQTDFKSRSSQRERRPSDSEEKETDISPEPRDSKKKGKKTAAKARASEVEVEREHSQSPDAQAIDERDRSQSDAVAALLVEQSKHLAKMLSDLDKIEAQTKEIKTTLRTLTRGRFHHDDDDDD